MDLRVTLDTMVHRALLNTRRQSDRLAVLHQQAATGKRLLEPSDDPVATVAVLANTAQDSRLEMYRGNVAHARMLLDISVSALTQAGTILSRARQIAIEATNPGNSPTAMEALASEVDRLLARMIDLANSHHNDEYIYAGTAVHTQPFVRDAVTSFMRYQGAQERGRAAVSPNLLVDTLYLGSEVFMARARATTVFEGTTGAAPGTGTDSATGRDVLQVRHTLTSYAPGSGIQPGSSSPAGDTILGPAGAHQLAIVDTSGTGAAGTVSLNGGPPVAFTNLDTDLAVTGPTGEVVFVDTTAITPGYSGTVAITADGTLSTDGGATTTPIAFTGNQVVVDSVTGGVTNVDSTNIRRAGDDYLEYSGTFDVFQTLEALRDDLRNTRELQSPEQMEAISGRIADINRVRDAILGVVGEQSASLQSLEGLQARIEDVQLETRRLTAELESADLSEVVLNLQAQENLFRTTLASAARIFDQSLLDFLR